jgi:hypothetical protein
MSRIETVKARVSYYYAQFALEMHLPVLDTDSTAKLKLLLERIYLFEKRCTLKKIKYSESVCIEFRGAIADLLLLLDDFDLQHAIATRSQNDEITANKNAKSSDKNIDDVA